MKWCEHCDSTGGNQLTITETVTIDGFRWSISDGKAVNFCPICGTPRPKEKSLEEKLREHWGTTSFHGDIFKDFAILAEEHFKEKYSL